MWKKGDGRWEKTVEREHAKIRHSQPHLPSTQLPTYTALLHTTEWDPVIAILAAVNPHRSGLDIPRNAVCLDKIGGEDCASKAISGVVGTLEGLVLRFEGTNDDKRTKNLFAENTHVGLHIGKELLSMSRRLCVQQRLLGRRLRPRQPALMQSQLRH